MRGAIAKTGAQAKAVKAFTGRRGRNRPQPTPAAAAAASAAGEAAGDLEMVEITASHSPITASHSTITAPGATAALRNGVDNGSAGAAAGGAGVPHRPPPPPRRLPTAPRCLQRLAAQAAGSRGARQLLQLRQLLSTLLVFLPVLCFVALGLAMGRIEGWSAVDSLYFACMTVSTVGYGDVAPQTEGGRAFALLYLPVGVITVANALSVLAHGRALRRADLASRSPEQVPKVFFVVCTISSTAAVSSRSAMLMLAFLVSRQPARMALPRLAALTSESRVALLARSEARESRCPHIYFVFCFRWWRSCSC
jgi:hypothetical protein